MVVVAVLLSGGKKEPTQQASVTPPVVNPPAPNNPVNPPVNPVPPPVNPVPPPVNPVPPPVNPVPPPVNPVPPPVNPAPPINPVQEAPPPKVVSGDKLRYQWWGGPHVYAVRVELEEDNYIDVRDGHCVVHAKPGSPAVQEMRKATGTGFVVNTNGYLVTCAHVVSEATKVEVILGGKTYPGTVVGVDHEHDVAVVQIAARNLPALPLGNSDSHAKVGMDVRRSASRCPASWATTSRPRAAHSRESTPKKVTRCSRSTPTSIPATAAVRW